MPARVFVPVAETMASIGWVSGSQGFRLHVVPQSSQHDIKVSGWANVWTGQIHPPPITGRK